jgi:hypothetical protein
LSFYPGLESLDKKYKPKCNKIDLNLKSLGLSIDIEKKAGYTRPEFQIKRTRKINIHAQKNTGFIIEGKSKYCEPDYLENLISKRKLQGLLIAL